MGRARPPAGSFESRRESNPRPLPNSGRLLRAPSPFLGRAGDNVTIKSKNIAIKAKDIVSAKGKRKLKLQEAQGGKGAKSGGKGQAGSEGSARTSKSAPPRKQRKAEPDNPTLEIHVADLDGKAQEGLVFEIKKPDGGMAKGKLDKDGRGVAKSTKPGTFTVTFPELDGGDWDGDGAAPLDEERGEASRVKATAEDRVPALARERGFRNWRTIWDFAGNAKLKKLRENPNVLWDGDEVAFPKKFQRAAKVVGGGAEYVVSSRAERWVSIRLLDSELAPCRGLRYQADVGNPAENRGVVPDDGYVVLEVPADAKRVGVSLFAPRKAEKPLFKWECEIREDSLSDSPGDRAQRLVNLGFARSAAKAEDAGEREPPGLLHYRSHDDNHEDDDAAVLDDLVAVHDDESGGGSKGSA